MSVSLSRSESDLLAQCEQVIGASIDTFRDVGRALSMIKEKALYRENFRSFEEYVAARWPFTRRHAARLMDASSVASEVERREDSARLANAATAAELKAFPKRQRQAIFDSAAKLALEAGTSVRVNHIKTVVKSLRQEAGRMGQDYEKVEAAPPPVSEKKGPIITVRAEPSCEVDREGNPLPDIISIREAFAARNWFNCILSTLKEAMDEVKSLAGRKPGTFLDEQKVLDALRTARHEISVAMPRAVCPYCQGTPAGGSCHGCKGLGWVAKHTWDSYAAETKPAVESEQLATVNS